MIGPHRQHIRLAALFQHAPPARIRAISGVGEHIGAGRPRIERGGNQLARDLGLGGEADLFRHMRFAPPRVVFRPALGQIKATVDQCLAKAVGVGQEHADLRIFDPPAVPEYCRATPTKCSPFFMKPVSSTASTPSGSASASMT